MANHARPSGAHILVVEDEPRLGDLLRLYLERDGYRVTVVTDGRAAIEVLEESGAGGIDLVVLDLMLPGLRGEAVLEAIRDMGDTPVLIASAKRSDLDRIAGLRMGADDYLAKPFNPHELTARVAAILRRSGAGRDGSVGAGDPVGVAAVTGRGARAGIIGGVGANTRLSLAGGRVGLDMATRRFTTADGATGRLTPAETGLLTALAREPGVVFTRDQLLDVVTRRPDEVVDRVVDVHVANLRRKLGDDPADPWLIETIPQTGYRLLATRDTEEHPGAAEAGRA